MFIEEMEILIECKRLVEDMLVEKRMIGERMSKCGKDTKSVEQEIQRLERALNGKRTIGYGRFNQEDK